MDKHTPGPWTTVPGEGYIYAGSVPVARARSDEQDERIGRGEYEANVALLASAPDLLAALRRLHDACEVNEDDYGDALDNARSALAKAAPRESGGREGT